MATTLEKSTRKPNRVFQPWDSPLDRFFRHDFTDFWNGHSQATVPSINFKEEKNNYLVSMAAPGLKKEDFNIEVEGNLLTISCDSEEEKNEKEEGYTRKEYNYSSFSRTVTLPEQADSKDIAAKYTDGILSLTIPKKPGSQQASQKIKVQ